MPKVSLNTIKSWFRTRLYPTQDQFWDTWDSFRHKDDLIEQSSVNGLETALQGKANANHRHDATDIDNLPDGGGGGGRMEISQPPVYYPDGRIKTVRYQYVDEPTAYFEQRLAYDSYGYVSMIEEKNDIPEVRWVRKTGIYSNSGQLLQPTIMVITEWSII